MQLQKLQKCLLLNVVTLDFAVSGFSRQYIWHYEDLYMKFTQFIPNSVTYNIFKWLLISI